MVREEPVIVYLTRSRIDLAVCCKGERPLARRVDVILPPDAGDWIAALRSVREQFTAAIQEMGCAGRGAIVLYDSPSQSADIISSPVRSTSAALSAAELACQDSLSYPASAGVMASMSLGHDHASAGHNTHVAVVADRNDTIDAVTDLIEHADLDVVSITPIDAAFMMQLSRRLLHEDKQCHGLLYVGEQHSYFLIGGDGVLRFHRRLVLGTDALVRALTRPIRSDQAGTETTLCVEQATQILHAHGFPSREDQICADPPLWGSDIIPLLLPSFQRFLVELRQSLRFGLTEEERSNLSIEITGPGACLPGLAKVICEEIDSGRCGHAVHSDFDPGVPCSDGSDIAYMAQDTNGLSSLSLLPSRLARSRILASLRRTLWTGAAVALIVVGADAWRAERQLDDASMRVSAVATKQSDREMLKATGTRIRDVLVGLRATESRIRAELAKRPPLSPLLLELSHLVEQPVQLVSLSVNPDGEGLTGVISGLVYADSKQSQDDVLESLVADMQASPLVSSVVLKNIQSGETGGQHAIRFDVEFDVVGYQIADIPADQMSAMNHDGAAQ